MEQYKKDFIERVTNHIDLVNKYANKIGHIYLYHDSDKLQGELFEPYALSMKDSLSDEEKKIYDKATIKHITKNPHHPEYFLNKKDMDNLVNNFTRENPHVMLDCTRMTDQAIAEMCCDWCAMAEEFGNTPFD